jgi:hydrogenase expression/formation protein HypC
MCLAIPGKVEQIYEQNGTRMGKVNFGGIVKDVCLAYVPDIVVGDYTIVHVGFAISRIDEASAQETLKTFHEIGLLEEELRADEESQRRSEDESGGQGRRAVPRGSRPN